VLAATACSGCIVRQVPLRPDDARIVVDAPAISRFIEGFHLDPKAATLRKRRILGGTTWVTYEYDPPSHDLYVLCDVYDFGDAGEALRAYHSFGKALRSVFEGAREVSLAPLDPRSIWQDNSLLFVLTRDGRPVGNAFLTRQGDTLLQLVVFGVYFEEPQALRELVSPTIVALWGYGASGDAPPPRRR
jgi:hypothetical protein